MFRFTNSWSEFRNYLNKDKFWAFDNVLLFGSSIQEGIVPEDIDLLLVYRDFTDVVLSEMKSICFFIEENLHMELDLTVMSINEVFETGFIEKISDYIQLK